MRIVQLIDSLEAGGAERMAVSYANALAQKITFSGLVATRQEGPLLNQLDKEVGYLFLKRKRSVDLQAFVKLVRFIKKHKISIVHAHSTSLFIAVIIKVTNPSVQLIWHDHYGDSEFLEKRPSIMIRFCIHLFSGIIAVNEKLVFWAKHQLHFKNVIYLPNFPVAASFDGLPTILSGSNGKRIVCLANLRPQKDHIFLLDIAVLLKASQPDWTFHLVGKFFDDAYGREILEQIKEKGLEHHVYFYGSRQDISAILGQCSIGVLTSSSEGLPVAVLEYGLHQLPVVVTNVGELPNIIQHDYNGKLIFSGNILLFHNAVVDLIMNKPIRNQMAVHLQQTIREHFSADHSIKKYLDWINSFS